VTVLGALTGSVLGQTAVARRLARLLDKAAGAVVVAAVILVLAVVGWAREHPVWAVLVGLVLLALLAWHLLVAWQRRHAIYERLTEWEQRPASERVMRYLYVWRAPLDPALCAPGEVPGECVYVGQTVRSLEQRTVEHTDEKPWMHPGLTCEVRTNFATDEALDEAEHVAIRTLRPRENVVYSVDVSRRTVRR